LVPDGEALDVGLVDDDGVDVSLLHPTRATRAAAATSPDTIR